MPLSGNFYAGKGGSASIDGTTLYGKSWTMGENVDEIKVTNFESPTVGDEKWHEFLGGFVGAQASIDCIGDPTLTLPARGSTIPFALGIGGGHSISGSMVLLGIDHKTDVEGVYLQSFKGRVTGPPTLV